MASGFALSHVRIRGLFGGVGDGFRDGFLERGKKLKGLGRHLAGDGDAGFVDVIGPAETDGADAPGRMPSDAGSSVVVLQQDRHRGQTALLAHAPSAHACS